MKKVLPTPVETVVIHDFLLVLSDALPDLAAHWLEADSRQSELWQLRPKQPLDR